MRVTGRVLPVLGHDDWQVEPVLVDRGTGVREWFEACHRDQVFYRENRAGLIRLLRSNGLRLDGFVEIEPEEGCE
jgi:hypothetical protein